MGTCGSVASQGVADPAAKPEQQTPTKPGGLAIVPGTTPKVLLAARAILCCAHTLDDVQNDDKAGAAHTQNGSAPAKKPHDSPDLRATAVGGGGSGGGAASHGHGAGGATAGTGASASTAPKESKDAQGHGHGHGGHLPPGMILATPHAPERKKPTTPKEIIEDVLHRTLKCHNCEQPDETIEVFCMECFYDDEDNHNNPAVFCGACDASLHKPAKKAKHKRKPFLQMYGDMKTVSQSPFALSVWPLPAELRVVIMSCHVLSRAQSEQLGLGKVPLPDSLKELCTIVCRNCEDPKITQWCTQCLSITCLQCSREIHKPARFRDHKRYEFNFEYIHK